MQATVASAARTKRKTQPKNKKTGRFEKAKKNKPDHQVEAEVNSKDAKAKQDDSTEAFLTYIDSRRLISFQGPGFYCTGNGLFFDPELWHRLDTDTNPSYRIMLKPEFDHQSKLSKDIHRWRASSLSFALAMSRGYVKATESWFQPMQWDYYLVRFVDKGVRLIPSSEVPNPWWKDAFGRCGGPISQVQVGCDRTDWSRKLETNPLELAWGLRPIEREDTYDGIYYDPNDPQEQEGGAGPDGVDGKQAERLPNNLREEEEELLEHMKNILNMTHELVPCIKMVCLGLGKLAERERTVANTTGLDPILKNPWLKNWKLVIKERQVKKKRFCADMEEAILDVQTQLRLWKRGLAGAWPSLSDSLPSECFEK